MASHPDTLQTEPWEETGSVETAPVSNLRYGLFSGFSLTVVLGFV